MADRIVIMKAGEIQQVGTPQQVYNEPANQFVAAFIGSPSMNFFAGRLQGDALRLADGTTVPLPAARAERLREHGSSAVQIGVRPEHLTLMPPAGPGVPVRVSVVEPLGSDTLVYFEFDGTRHVARVAPEVTPHAGQTLHVGIPPARAHLFDAATGATLR